MVNPQLRPWGRACFSICLVRCFMVYYQTCGWGNKAFPVDGPRKSGEGADKDLLSQIYLPNLDLCTFFIMRFVKQTFHVESVGVTVPDSYGTGCQNLPTNINCQIKCGITKRPSFDDKSICLNCIAILAHCLFCQTELDNQAVLKRTLS